MRILNILLMFLHIGLIGQNNYKEKTTLKLYAYPINSFTKIPLNKNNIKTSSKFKTKIKKGGEFISRLESMLSQIEVSQEVKELNSNIRIYIEVCIKNKKTNEIIINKGKNIQYKGKCYNLNNDLMLHILELIPDESREEYTPIYLQQE